MAAEQKNNIGGPSGRNVTMETQQWTLGAMSNGDLSKHQVVFNGYWVCYICVQ